MRGGGEKGGDEEEFTRVCVKNLPKSLEERRLKEHFSGCGGRVTDVKIVRTRLWTSCVVPPCFVCLLGCCGKHDCGTTLCGSSCGGDVVSAVVSWVVCALTRERKGVAGCARKLECENVHVRVRMRVRVC